VPVIRRKSGKKSAKIPIIIKKNMPLLFFRKSGILLVILCVLLFLSYLVKQIIIKSPFFIVKKIEITPKTNLVTVDNYWALKSLRNKNIFKINGKDVSRNIKKDYPQVRRVIVRRVLPDTIEITVVQRIPFAIVKSFSYFTIDRDAVVLSQTTEGDKKLPVISGVSMWSRPKIGQIFAADGINTALYILEYAAQSNILLGYKIDSVEISNTRNLKFFLDNGLEVRIDNEAVREKFKKLSTIIKDPKINLKSLQYVDLRFKDAVMGPK